MSALLENGHMSDLMKSQGFAAISFWFDGKEHHWTARVVQVFQTLLFVWFAVAMAGGFYAYGHPVDYSSSTDCPRLIMFVLVTAVMLAIYLTFGLLSVFITSGIFATINKWLIIAGLGLFFLIFNIFASVWVWSAPGKYYSETGCSVLLVNGVKTYLAVWWGATAFSVAMTFAMACGIVASGAKPENNSEYMPVAQN